MKRFFPAGRFAPAAVASALALMSLACAAGAKDLYVATGGRDTNLGTSASPYKTIQKGIDVAQPGDRVLVRDGTYNEAVTFKRSGTASGIIKLEAVNKRQAKIVANARYAIMTDGYDYLQVSNLDVRNNFDQTYDSTGIAVINSHHVALYGNKVHDCGGNGIGAKYSDSLTIEFNDVHNNTDTSIYQTSGISIYQPQRLSGGDWNTKIRYNRCWANQHTVRNPNNNTVTDGNGIIIDNTKGVDQSDDFGVPGSNVVYDKWILVDSNMCWNNGGAGVSTYAATKVLIRNNSCYNNRRVIETGAAEITVGNGDNVQVINNAILGRGGYNLTQQYGSTNVQWSNNCLANGNNSGATLWNTIYANPQFVDQANGNLHIKSSSPCRGAATTDWGVNDKDIDYENRTQGALDIGADEIN